MIIYNNIQYKENNDIIYNGYNYSRDISNKDHT